MNEEMRELRVVLNALANQQGLLQWVTAWAVGKNEGGLYVSLFNERLQYRVCTVYHERIRELPAFIRESLPADGDAPDISTDRTKLEAQDAKRPPERRQLHVCTPFQIARYAVGDGEKAAWRFSGVVRVAQQQRQEEQPAAAAPAQPAPASDNPFEDKERERQQQQRPAHGKASREQLIELHKAGRQAYGAAWDEKRHKLVEMISHGQATSSNDLTPKECDDLIAGIRKKLAEAAANVQSAAVKARA